MPSRRRALLVIAVLLAAGLLSLAGALLVGSYSITPGDVWARLTGSGGGTGGDIVLGLRLPRALAAFACGALLALAGTLMQVMLRNPLADPYVLGVSGGAAVGALSAMLFGLPLIFVHGGSFAGALAAMLTVFGLARGDGSWTQSRLLLTGVIVAAGCGAGVALILSVAPEQNLHSMLFWLMGDLSHAGSPWPALAVAALGLALVMPIARDLNLLSRGDLVASTLGVKVRALRAAVSGLGSLLTAVAVTTTGSVGFIGLVVPHLMRLAIGNDQRVLLPAATLAGGALLVVADTLARTVIAPQQLPVGVLTALLGVPVFLYLLSRQPKGGRE